MIEKEFIIAIDPGLTGGIAALGMDGEVIFTWPMPTYEEKKGRNTLDLNTLRTLLLEVHNCNHCFVEKVSAMPGQGVSSMFKFGRGFGAIEGMLAAMAISTTFVHPATWTKVMHKDLDRKLKPKARSLIVYKRQYPLVNLLATPRSKKPHEGMMDALLIAEYGRRELIKS